MKSSYFWIAFATFLVCLLTPVRAAAQFNRPPDDQRRDDQRRGDQPPTIVCESRHHRLQYCAVGDPRAEVVMVQQLSNEQCVRGQTWGNDAKGIWVDRGCRASFQLRPSRADGPGWWNSGPGRPRNLPSSGACFFKNVNFSGEYFCRDRGSNIGQVALDDEISSIQIYGRARVTIYKDPGFNGPQATTDRSIPDLHQWRMPNNPNLNWDNRISSARID